MSISNVYLLISGVSQCRVCDGSCFGTILLHVFVCFDPVYINFNMAPQTTGAYSVCGLTRDVGAFLIFFS